MSFKDFLIECLDDHSLRTILVSLILALILVVNQIFNQMFFKIKSPTQTIENFSKQPLIITIPVRYELSSEMVTEIKYYKNMTITSYSNRIEETDSTPNHTATGRLVYEGSCAVSQDLFKKDIKPGDIVYIKKLDKYLIVEDTMNKRHTQHIDVFLYKRRRQDGSLPKEFLRSFQSDVYVIKTVH